MKALCGGEALSKDLANHLLDKVDELWNMYGPTETTVWSTIVQVHPDPDPITIGRPISNTQIYILDDKFHPVPVGVKGELFIGGEGLARGYNNLVELTKEKFLPNPFVKRKGSRLYRTGDLARYISDGRIEWLGRVDQQIKIRGFRIELGEIESILVEHREIKKAVVSTYQFGNLNKLLVAYFVPNGSLIPDPSELRAFLKEKLPEYMVPVSFVSMSSIPLTPNGKVNYLELPKPQILEENLNTSPRNSVERELIKIMEQVLDVKPIGIRENFFDLGGHSLLAIRLLNRVESIFGIYLPIATIFQSPTIEEMALVVSGKITPPDWSVLVPIRKEGSQRPVFCVHGAGGGIIGYAALSKALGTDQPFFGLQARGVDDHEEPQYRIEEMASFYIDQIRRFQPTGPYNLAGYSFGGYVAYEMACQLRDQGHEVGLLAVFDTYAMSRQKAFKLLWQPKNLFNFILNIPAWIRDQILLKFVRSSNKIYIPERKHVLEAHIEALRHYKPPKYDGKVSLFRVRTYSLLRSFDPEFGWGELASAGVDTYILPGSHFNMLEEPFVAKLADQLKASLAIVQAKN